MSAWDKLDQRLIDIAVKEWQTQAKSATFNTICPKKPLFYMYMLCLCASEALRYICCKLPFVSIKCRTCVGQTVSCNKQSKAPNVHKHNICNLIRVNWGGGLRQIVFIVAAFGLDASMKMS